MLSSGSLSSGVTTSTAAAVTATAAQLTASATSTSSGGAAPSPQLDKSEINDAVTKVLKGYDWTLVPTATK